MNALKRTGKLTSLGAAVALALVACGGDDEAGDAAPNAPAVTSAPDATRPPATEPAATEPPATEPAATEPAGTEASSTAEFSGLPEGPFVLTAPGGPPVTVTIPAPGWSELDQYGALLKNERSDPPDGAALLAPYYGEFYVYGDPCAWSTTTPDTPVTTVDDFVAAMTAQASRDASAPVDIAVDGYAGKSMTIRVPDDSVDAECDDGKFASWAGGGEPPSAGPSRWHQGPGQIDELWIVDVDGTLMVMDAMYGTETPAEHVAELHAILESMTFEE